jgi:urea carboxylase
MFDKILIANRGAIACRILRTLQKMGIKSVAVYSEADATSLHVLQADEAYCIGPAPAAQSYLSIPAILKAAKDSGAQAIHPGYGFLSESIEFARACQQNGIAFIGPTVENIEAFALKHTARSIAEQCGVPLLPGTGLLANLNEAHSAAADLTYPVMLKSSAGGGGIGMRICATPDELTDAYESVVRLSQNSFGDGRVYLEKFIARAKHVEVQIFGDGKGGVLTLGARDCSSQRRHQKVLEETPVPGLEKETEQELFTSARLLGNAVNYLSAGTVEFIFDADTHRFYFLEVNTRLQVEHGVTEQVTGLDLVEMMVQAAAGDLPRLAQLHRDPHGCSIEARIYAEDPAKGFQPAPGKLSSVIFPPAELARTETWVESGSEVTPYYDPMIAKIIVTGQDRIDAVAKMQAALASTSIFGTETNLRFLRAVVACETFTAGEMITATLAGFTAERRAIEVIEGGMQTTIQDYPGRLGYWHVGVPPSGPMDSFAFRIANCLVGNPEGASALEMTGSGAKLRFDCAVEVAICGADMSATVNGQPAPLWESFQLKAGDELQLSAATAAGWRSYLAIHGGIEAPQFLASASTFMLGGFGGHAGRSLRAGDVIHIARSALNGIAAKRSTQIKPRYDRHWDVAVTYGPHGAPEFFNPDDIEMIFSTDWRVHYQSDRTGIRLIGPKPEWARKDGGDAGLHPSNIHDNAYAIGAIDFTGDMPILLGPDGPSLGGFVCPAVVVSAELWKLGQMKAGDTVRFHRITESQASELEAATEAAIANLTGEFPVVPASVALEPAILQSSTARTPQTVYRADGDKYLLIEYGERVLDLALRFRVHLLEQKLRALNLPGVIDVTPGVRSLQIHYNSRLLPRTALLDALESIDSEIPETPDVTVPSRTVYMPLSWNDPATQLAQSKYMHSVRPDAPWCPDNIEFIRRINGLDSVQQVHEIVHAASYLVLGLGDVYLGAPVATPVDPRHRLVTTKYNPARTWTPENAVGIGGAYMCVYGMEGPGGYQLVGRTVQVWNTYKSTPTFPPGTPWSLRFFDQIRFYPVSSEELLDLRSQIPHGGFNLRMDEGSFNLREYQQFLASIAPEANVFRSRQQAAFREERERWRVNGLLEVASPLETTESSQESASVPPGCKSINSPMTASVFQISVEAGQRVSAGAKLLVLDAMKTEIIIAAPSAGVVEEVRCTPGKLVHAGQTLIVLRTTNETSIQENS